MATKQAADREPDELDERQLLKVLMAIKKGDFSARMPIDKSGVAGKIADTLNDVIELNERMSREFERINTVVGKEGQDKQLAVLNDLVLNATVTAPAFDKAKADAAVTALAQRHAPLLTGSSAEVAGGKRLPANVDEAKVACSFAVALFKDLSTMDGPTAELTLRSMFAGS